MFASEFCFGVELKTCQFLFYSIDIVITTIVLSGISGVGFTLL